LPWVGLRWIAIILSQPSPSIGDIQMRVELVEWLWSTQMPWLESTAEIMRLRHLYAAVNRGDG